MALMTKEEKIQKYEPLTHKKIGGWITMISFGGVFLIGGYVMFLIGLIVQEAGLWAPGLIMFLASFPLLAIGITFTVMNAVRRGVAKKKLSRIE